MGQHQHICSTLSLTSRHWRLGRRVCLRKGCGSEFQPHCWNQRYCQDPECLRLVRRWQAAKRQRRRRENVEHRKQHREAERERRKRRKDDAKTQPIALESANRRDEDQPWSRSNRSLGNFCDRPGCYDPLRCSCRAQARYCGDDCAQTMRRVLDRERKWLRRNRYVGRFKRQLEYEEARHKRARDAAPLPES